MSVPDQLSFLIPSVLEKLVVIKNIQSVMKEPSMIHKSFAETYQRLSEQFEDFANQYPLIFTKVVRGDDLSTLAGSLYYEHCVETGTITSEALAQNLFDHYASDELKQLHHNNS